MIQRRRSIEQTQYEGGKYRACDRLQSKAPAKRFDGIFVENRHANDATTAAGHNEYLDEFTFLFEILCHHNGGTVTRDADAKSDN